jgi:hypothetical protein
MSDFKVNKPKALAGAVIHTLYDKSEAIVASLSKTHPHLAPLLRFTQANFVILLAYRQEKLNQFVEHLMENEDTYTEEKVNDPKFQDGAVVFLDTYFKLRSDEKLKLAQNIFLNFAKSPNMPLYPLERYDDTLEKLSQAGIQFLGFIDQQVPRLQREHALYRGNQNANDVGEANMANLVKTYSSKPINFFIDFYAEKQTNERMKSYVGNEILAEQRRIKSEILLPFDELKAELEQLGLAKNNISAGTIGGFSGEGASEYFNLTEYGKKFISIVRPEVVYSFASE